MVCKTLPSLQTKLQSINSVHCNSPKKNTSFMALCFSGSQLEIKAGSFYIPKDNPEKPRGEDAHFICPEKNAFGVADGVGGWDAKGVDSGEYARRLMANSLAALKRESKRYVNPARVLLRAYESTHEKGSSTACIIAVNGKFLDFANVGDSGLMVFRGRKMVYRSPVQQHGFNCPYQLGRDEPGSGHQHIMVVEEGDVVVAGTDGLYDNMYPSEIVGVLNEEGDEEPAELARRIAECAVVNARNEDYYSPFEQSAEDAGVDYEGGKYDDITVIVAKIV